MEGTLKLENCKLKIANCLAAAAILLSGCLKAPEVTVTIKAVGGATGDGAAPGDAGATEAKGYGSLSGTITFDGDAPAPKPLIAAGDSTVKDAAVCAAVAIPDESLVVNPSSKGVANVVIFLEKRPANIKPELAKPPEEPAMFDQKGCRFMPHVLTVQVGQPMLIISKDNASHNTHTYPKRSSSFSQLIAPNENKGVPLNYKKPEASPLEVKCDFHPWMKAYHFPVDHPYVAVTDENGKFKIDGLPAGKHAFNIWHERAPGGSQLLERKLEIVIEADKDTVKDLSYGAAKFAGLPRSSAKSVAYQRLLDGGEITVTQREE